MSDGALVQRVAEQAELVVALAKSLGLSIATCESLTGGAVGAALTGVAGASAVYIGGYVTYATAQKPAMAGVDAAHIAAHGVINAETAKQMACGVLINTGADLAVSTTGVAGPEGQDGHAPGEVWVGLAWRDEHDRVTATAMQHHFDGDRATIRTASVDAALAPLLSHLEPLGLHPDAEATEAN